MTFCLAACLSHCELVPMWRNFTRTLPVDDAQDCAGISIRPRTKPVPQIHGQGPAAQQFTGSPDCVMKFCLS